MEGLSDKAKKYLQAIHRRFRKNCQLAKDPSMNDLKALGKVYGKDEYC